MRWHWAWMTIILYCTYLLILSFVNKCHLSAQLSAWHQGFYLHYAIFDRSLNLKAKHWGLFPVFIKWEPYQRGILAHPCQMWIKLFMLWFQHTMMTVNPSFLALAIKLPVIQLIQKAAAHLLTWLKSVDRIFRLLWDPMHPSDLGHLGG